MTRALFVLLLGGALSACTVSERYSADGRIEARSWAFGPAALPDVRSGFERTSGVGLAWRDGQAVLGYFSAEAYLLPCDDCAVIVIPNRRARPIGLVALHSLMKGHVQ